MAKKAKPKKRRPVPVTLTPGLGWNLGRHVRITIESDKPIPAFLKTMIDQHQKKGD